MTIPSITRQGPSDLGRVLDHPADQGVDNRLAVGDCVIRHNRLGNFLCVGGCRLAHRKDCPLINDGRGRPH